MSDTQGIRSVLADKFGLEPRLTRLGGEGENYAVELREARYALKIADTELKKDVLELEFAATDAVGQTGWCRVPTAVPTRDGARSFLVEGDTGRRSARLLAWVDGKPWREAPQSDEEALYRTGRRLGSIALALSEIDPNIAEVGKRTHLWDLACSRSLFERARIVEDRARRTRLYEIFASYSALFLPVVDSLPHGLIHGDLNDDNLRLIDAELAGVIDFGDVLWNPLVCELAIALAYLCLERADPFAVICPIVRGYDSVRRLSADELEVLWPLICMRLAASVVISTERRRVDPGRDGWFSTEAAACTFLASFTSLAPAEVAKRIATGLEPTPFPECGMAAEQALAQRRAHASEALSLSYSSPLHFERGSGHYLIDSQGRSYLDLYNNVTHVGHCHPHVVKAGQRQMATLNTNTRYLSSLFNNYTEQLCATLPDRLEVCFLVNSGSEANELALRLARSHTGSNDLIVLENAYHGHTTTLTDISPYKHRAATRPIARPEWLRVAEIPDPYRGEHRKSPKQGKLYGDAVGALVQELQRPTYLAESLICCGGQVIPPAEYLATVFEHVRAAGGLCVLDEVQVGFGRVGSHFWAFEQQGVVPDIVVMGKPIGNGHPLSAVVCTRAVANSFAVGGLEYFATFGGNPVSCAIGLAVLEVIEAEGLQEHARCLGAHLLDALRELAANHSCIGDVRGAGLFLGIEFVKDRETRAPAPALARRVVEELCRARILTGIDGPFQNVIKLKPPMVVRQPDVDRFVDTLEAILEGVVSVYPSEQRIPPPDR